MFTERQPGTPKQRTTQLFEGAIQRQDPTQLLSALTQAESEGKSATDLEPIVQTAIDRMIQRGNHWIALRFITTAREKGIATPVEKTALILRAVAKEALKNCHTGHMATIIHESVHYGIDPHELLPAAAVRASIEHATTEDDKRNLPGICARLGITL